MNVSLSWSASIHTTVLVQDSILPNLYELNFDLITNTNDHEEQLIYFNRLRWLIEAKFNVCTIADYNNITFKTLTTLDQTIFQIGDIPSELLIAGILMRKCSAILENKFIIDRLTLSSSLGDYVKYKVKHDEIIDGVQKQPWVEHPSVVWWERPDTAINDLGGPNATWDELQLTIKKGETKKKKKGFNPTVIKGGKDET